MENPFKEKYLNIGFSYKQLQQDDDTVLFLPECLICDTQFTSWYPSNFHRHFRDIHKKSFDGVDVMVNILLIISSV